MSEETMKKGEQPPTDYQAGDDTTPGESTPHPLEAELDIYPLRAPSEDPKWSLRFVKGWFYFLMASLAFLFFLVVSSFLVE